MGVSMRSGGGDGAALGVPCGQEELVSGKPGGTNSCPEDALISYGDCCNPTSLHAG
jgi:hypothetical protein